MGCGSSKSDANVVAPPQNVPSSSPSSSPSLSNSAPPPKPAKPASASLPPPPSPEGVTESAPDSNNKFTNPPPPPPPPTSRTEELKTESKPAPPVASPPPARSAPASPPPKEIVKKFQPMAGFTIITENESTKEKVYLSVMHHPSVETFISIEPRSLELDGGIGELSYYVFVIPSDLFNQVVKDNDAKSQICLQILSHTNQLYHTQTSIKTYDTKFAQ